jgi:HlyD family secretion protein
MKKISLISLALLILFSWSCRTKSQNFVGSGNFEANEILISSQANGEIINFNITEGDKVLKNEVLGLIDTAQLFIKKQQLTSALASAKARQPEKNKQISAYEEQISVAKKEQKRIESLVAEKVVGQKQLDDINNQIAVLEKQLETVKSTLDMTINGVKYEAQAIEYQIKEIDLGIRKSCITSPIDGVILSKYSQAGELTGQGRPLFKVANTDTLIMRTYITNSLLSQIKIGDILKINVDNEGETLQGTVIWISDKAEFTPKGILTKNERENLVYAVKLLVPNNGYLRIGMYGEVYK